MVNEAITEHGAIGPPAGLGYLLTAPTIVAHGNDRQKREDLLRILNGQDAWCQLFSEPGAGSDLASLSTKAVKDGDEWIITGQKVWTSTAQLCNLGMLIARTAPDLPKHKGITYFKFDMQQPGVEIRPLREMTGRALFNEVFIDDARVHDDDIIGGLNNGWAVSEHHADGRARRARHRWIRCGRATRSPARSPRSSTTAPATTSVRSARVAPAAAASRAANRLTKLAQELGKNTDPNIRQKLAQLYTLQQIGRYSSLRAKSPSQRTGGEPNIAKLMMSDLLRLQREVGNEIIGPYGMVMGTDTPGGGMVQEVTLFSPGPVDLRRYRPGAAQHHRRARARAAQGARTGEGHAVQGAPRQQLGRGRERRCSTSCSRRTGSRSDSSAGSRVGVCALHGGLEQGTAEIAGGGRGAIGRVVLRGRAARRPALARAVAPLRPRALRRAARVPRGHRRRDLGARLRRRARRRRPLDDRVARRDEPRARGRARADADRRAARSTAGSPTSTACRATCAACIPRTR